MCSTMQVVLVVGEARARGGAWRPSCGQRGRRRRRRSGTAASPSSEPVSGSTACSGCGISPTTLPAALETPAMSRAEPFGFSPGRVAERDLAAGLELVEHRLGRVVAAGRVLDGDRERARRACTRPSTPCRRSPPSRRPACRGSAGSCSAAARRAAAPPRTGPGSRCRCRAPGRPRGRSARPPPSPARSARSRRPAGSRRRRSRRG